MKVFFFCTVVYGFDYLKPEIEHVNKFNRSACMSMLHGVDK